MKGSKERHVVQHCCGLFMDCKGVRVCVCVQYEYFNAVLINEVDEDGNSVELGGEFVLEPNDHFNNLSVNLSLSVVQVPTNMYNKGKTLGSNPAFTRDKVTARAVLSGNTEL